jgi:hypothetical protein
MSTTINEPEYSILKQQIQQIKDQGKVFSNKDIYTWTKWHYRKGRFWTDKYILPNLKWRKLETRGYPSKVIGKYLPIDELQRDLRSMLNDYSI